MRVFEIYIDKTIRFLLANITNSFLCTIQTWIVKVEKQQENASYDTKKFFISFQHKLKRKKYFIESIGYFLV